MKQFLQMFDQQIKWYTLIFLSTDIAPVIQHTRISGMCWTCYSIATFCASQCHMMPNALIWSTVRKQPMESNKEWQLSTRACQYWGLSDVQYWMSCFTTKVGLQQSWWPNYQLNNLVYSIVYNIVYNTNLKLSWCDCQYCILNTSTNTVYYILYCIYNQCDGFWVSGIGNLCSKG